MAFIVKAFTSILTAISSDSDPIEPAFICDKMGRYVIKAWRDQRKIGWSNILKGRISLNWSKAQQIYYSSNPETRNKKYMNQTTWAKRTVLSLLELALGVWNDRCKVLHGEENKDQRFKLKQSLQIKVEKCYRNKEDIHPSHHSLFQESVEDMCSKKSIQHLRCWIHSYHVAEAYSI